MNATNAAFQHRKMSISISSRLDPSSFANHHQVVTKHIDIEWEVCFNRRVIQGTVTLHRASRSPMFFARHLAAAHTPVAAVELLKDAPCVVLDTRGIAVQHVQDASTGIDLPFVVAEPHKGASHAVRCTWLAVLI